MNIKPTESELEILQILWDNGASTVRFVNSVQNKMKRVGYTTTLKMMQIMTEKKLLTVNKNSKQHIYSSAIDQEQTKSSLLNSFVKKTYQGSASKLMMQLLGDYKPTEQELSEIKKYLDDIETKKQ